MLFLAMIYSVFKNGVTINSFYNFSDAVKFLNDEVKLSRSFDGIYYLSLGYFTDRMELMHLININNNYGSYNRERIKFTDEYYQLLIDDL